LIYNPFNTAINIALLTNINIEKQNMPPLKTSNPIIISLLSVTFIISGCLNSTNTEFKQTTIGFLTTKTDFGNIPQSHPRTAIFAFTNTGKHPLVIYTAEAGCGCTTPEYPKAPIAPGKTGEIKVAYDAKETGRFTKTVTVYHNGENGMDVLEIKGMVVSNQ
jgi:hypothetical protein